MIPRIRRAFAPMFHAGGPGFNASRFAASDTIPWKTQGNRGKHNLPEEHENLGYTPDEYLSVDTNRQAQMAVEFVNQHPDSILRLVSMKIPTKIFLQKATIFSRTGPIDMVDIPIELIDVAAEYGIVISSILYFTYPDEYES